MEVATMLELDPNDLANYDINDVQTVFKIPVN